MNASLIINPVAGNKAFRSIKKIKDLLKDKISFNIFITQKRGDALSFTKGLSDIDLIIVAGGDGTFNEVINGMLSVEKKIPAKKSLPLALIPLGTSNVLAKELAIPEDVEKSIHLALTGKPKKISLGRINNHYFSLMAGIGFDGEAVLGVKNNIIKKISGKGAHILSGFRTLMRYKPPLISIKTPEGNFTGYTAVIGNARYYGGYFQVAPKACITEPVLDLCLFKGKKRKDLIRYVSGVIKKRHLDFDDVFYEKFSEFEITSEGKVHVQIDGDYFGTLPVKIDVVKDAISILIP